MDHIMDYSLYVNQNQIRITTLSAECRSFIQLEKDHGRTFRHCNYCSVSGFDINLIYIKAHLAAQFLLNGPMPRQTVTAGVSTSDRICTRLCSTPSPSSN